VPGLVIAYALDTIKGAPSAASLPLCLGTEHSPTRGRESMIRNMTTKRVTVTVPEDLLSSIRERIGERELSAYVTEALARQDRIDRLGELSDRLQEEYGAVTDEELAEARRVREAAQSRIAAQLAAARRDAA
jgi:hypothetical protein